MARCIIGKRENSYSLQKRNGLPQSAAEIAARVNEPLAKWVPFTQFLQPFLYLQKEHFILITTLS